MAQSIMRSGSERLSSGGAAVNSVRLSLLLACTAVCAAPGLLPVAGFPHKQTAITQSEGAENPKSEVFLDPGTKKLILTQKPKNPIPPPARLSNPDGGERKLGINFRPALILHWPLAYHSVSTCH